MSKKFFNHFTRKRCSCLMVLSMLLYTSTYMFPQATAEHSPEAINVDGYLVGVQSTEEVNTFLSGSPTRSKLLSRWSDRGMDPEKFKYVTVSSDLLSSNNELEKLVNQLNTVADKYGMDIQVTSVEAWIGGYQHKNGNIEAVVLIVANLEGGEQRLLMGLQIDKATWSNKGKPTLFEGDFFDSTVAAAVPGGYLDCISQCLSDAGIVIPIEALICAVGGLFACIGSTFGYPICAAIAVAACGITVGAGTLIGCALGCAIF